MSSYDSYLLRGSDDWPDYPETPSEIRARLKRFPYEFDLEGVLDANDLPWTVMINSPGRHMKIPMNARARRIRQRIFHRLTRRDRKAREAMRLDVTCWNFDDFAGCFNFDDVDNFVG